MLVSLIRGHRRLLGRDDFARGSLLGLLVSVLEAGLWLSLFLSLPCGELHSLGIGLISSSTWIGWLVFVGRVFGVLVTVC